MVIHELSEVECRSVLSRARYGRLACSREDQPYVVPFFFYLDPANDHLYSFSTVGQKIDWMRHNPKVCVEVDEIVDRLNWTTVLAFGRYEELSDAPKDDEARRRAHELLQLRTDWWLPGIGHTSHEEPRSPLIYRIAVDRLTGRRASRAR
jgi:nitroimidazol reductase NimA-like FMN-containing flavoprotein (pyridoxamine 5'-phosphate oxidase superfamily)